MKGNPDNTLWLIGRYVLPFLLSLLLPGQVWADGRYLLQTMNTQGILNHPAGAGDIRLSTSNLSRYASTLDVHAAMYQAKQDSSRRLYRSRLDDELVEMMAYEYPLISQRFAFFDGITISSQTGMSLSLPGALGYRADSTWQSFALEEAGYRLNTGVRLDGDISQLWDYRFDLDYQHLSHQTGETSWGHRAAISYHPLPRTEILFGTRLFADGRFLSDWQELRPSLELEWQLD